MAETPSKRHKSSISGGSDKASYSCQLCQRSYDRVDHLNRHLDSHRNERTFRCSECPRGFNRRDLLLRHQATHSKGSSGSRVGNSRTAERAFKACDACVISKLKCDNQRPCQRCQKRKIECKTDSLNQKHSQQNGDDTESVIQAIPTPPHQTPDDARQVFDNDITTDGSRSTQVATAAFDNSLMPGMDDWQFSDLNLGPFDFPSFFEHIMVPGSDYVSAESMQIPPDISTLMPDKDWFDETNIFGLDFTPTIDQAIEAEAFAFPEPNNEQAEINDEKSASRATDHAGRRHTIFQRSPWLWKPETNQNAFSEHNNIPLDERSIDMAASPHQPFLPSLILEDRLLPQTRDKIFQLVIKTAKSQVTIPSFPSAKCLETLLKVGIAKRVETDAWIHPYTLCSETSRPELLTALIAAGCVCFGIPSVSKTGLILFEIARVALARLIEDDNSVIRDLQFLQASMMWIDICAFCGFKRKMEIAESNLQPLVTALRRFGKFDRVAYSAIVPTYIDEGDELETKWKRWVEQESFKRLVHHVFEHDIYTTTAKVRNPLISYAEMTLPLPASRDLWLAPNAEAWKATYLGKSRDSSQQILSVRDLLADSELVKYLPETIDATSAKTLHLYGLAALTWEHNQQDGLLSSPLANVDPSAKLWLQSRHQKLYETFQGAQTSLKDCSAVTRLFHQFLMMALHVNADEITRFAGKCGEDEAHRAYKELQSWLSSKNARKAVWHAAQVLRVARTVPPYQLRGSDAFLIYHAVMVLWSYGLLRRDAARRTGSTTPANGVTGTNMAPSDTRDTQIVVLDGESNSITESFIVMGGGRVCLQMNESTGNQRQSQLTQLCDLQNPQLVMAGGVKVLEGNYPGEARSKLPQLIKSLCDLMSELGSLR